MVVYIGPFRFKLTSDQGDAEIEKTVRTYIPNFVAPEGEWDYEVRFQDELPGEIKEKIDREKSGWQMLGDGEYGIVLQDMPCYVSLGTKSILVSSRHSGIRLSPYLGFVMDRFKLVSIFLGLQHGYVAVHSSNVLVKNRSVLFMGVSGSGKSTISDLLSSHFMTLGDELNFIGQIGQEVFAYSAPFSKEERISKNRYGRSPLDAMCMLHKSEKVCVESLPLRDGFSNLIQNVFFSGTAELKEKAFEIGSAIAYSVPFFNVHFRNSTSESLELSHSIAQAVEGAVSS